METLKSVIGLGSKSETSKEPVNGETGAGTATDPYDAGNNEEASAAAESASAEPTIASKLASPVAAVADGTATEPENNIKASEAEEAAAPVPTTNGVENTVAKESTDVGSGVETAQAAQAAPATAVAWVPDPSVETVPGEHTAIAPEKQVESTLAGEAAAPHETIEPPTAGKGIAPDETAGSTAPIGGIAPDETVSSTPAVATADKIEAPAKPTEQPSKATKEPKIGSPSWFKNTIRRKSKTPAASEEKKSTSVVPIAEEKSTSVEPVAETKAKDVEPVAETKPTEYETPSSKTEEAAEIVALPAAAIAAETAKTEKVDTPVTTAKTTAPAVAEPKPKKERSLSRDFKLFKSNPFKRHSKAGIEEEKPEKSSEAPLAGAAAGGAVLGAGVADVDEKSKDTPVTEPVSDVATAEPAAVSEPAAEEEPTAPNHLSAEVPPGAAEPALDQSPPVQEQSVEETSSKAALDDSVAPDEIPAPTASKAELDEDIAPDQVAKNDPVSETSAAQSGDGIPTITEPVDSMAGSRADSTVDKDKAIKPSRLAPGENLSAIPTAGGIPLGQKAMEDRQAGQDYRRKSFEPSETDSTAVKTESVVSKPVDNIAAPDAKSTTPVEVNGKADVPQRRLSVIDKLKSKLKH